MGRVYSLFIENLALPVNDIVRRTSIFKFGHVLQKTQWFSRQEIERLQTRNLRVLLRHAYETVPYYRKAFRERKLSPSDIRSADDLTKLPILTKAYVRKKFRDLVSRGFPRSSLILSRSGGTGDQIEFYTTKEDLSWVVAAEYRAYGWGGYRRGGYEAHMKTELFREGVEKLLEVAKERRVCIMCMEKNPKYCHRRFLTAYMERKGVEVIHILEEGQVGLMKFKDIIVENCL